MEWSKSRAKIFLLNMPFVSLHEGHTGWKENSLSPFCSLSLSPLSSLSTSLSISFFLCFLTGSFPAALGARFWCPKWCTGSTFQSLCWLLDIIGTRCWLCAIGLDELLVFSITAGTDRDLAQCQAYALSSWLSSEISLRFFFFQSGDMAQWCEMQACKMCLSLKR